MALDSSSEESLVRPMSDEINVSKEGESKPESWSRDSSSYHWSSSRVKEYIAKQEADPAFQRLGKQLARCIPTAWLNGGNIHENDHDQEQFHKSVRQVLESPDFLTHMEHSNNLRAQDPNTLRNNRPADTFIERMAAQIEEDPELKTMRAEIDARGLSAVMKDLDG
ncbi:unnamed protein product [Microthlaspi erraticum]|uniref:STI1/HOP DP domain-containing protein n=1 Tax=Microthlaspi erraticum TaxID=1685480 RepID=A0A6D2HUY7_9BRAS|nr:unnamed protein product [Microthlaspi erraticum]